MTRVAGVILMGGRGERLGVVDKAALTLGGQTMLARVLPAFATCHPLLLATGETARPHVAGDAIADLPLPYAGPLAGVAAAVATLQHHPAPPGLLLSAAVDTPFFPADFVSRALNLLGDADVVMAAFGGQDYPTNALWRLPALAALPESMHAGTAPHSLRRLAGSLSLRRLDYAAFTADDPFANANTPQELANLRQRAADPHGP